MDVDAPNYSDYEAAMPTADADLGPRLGRAKAILDVGAILGAIFFQKNPCGERTKLCPRNFSGSCGFP